MEGINSRMDGLQAAILNAKLPHLPAWTEARRCVAACYNEVLANVGDLVPHQKSDPTRATCIICMSSALRTGMH